MPTASAVVADIIDAARSLAGDTAPPLALNLSEDVRIRPMSELETKYYLRLSVADRPGVLGQIAGVLGAMDISIASVIQKEADEVAQTAEIVLMTHRAREASMQQALRMLEELEVVAAVGNMVRVEEWDG
jgi:homoserine dehydrogenase